MPSWNRSTACATGLLAADARRAKWPLPRDAKGHPAGRRRAYSGAAEQNFHARTAALRDAGRLTQKGLTRGPTTFSLSRRRALHPLAWEYARPQLARDSSSPVRPNCRRAISSPSSSRRAQRIACSRRAFRTSSLPVTFAPGSTKRCATASARRRNVVRLVHEHRELRRRLAGEVPDLRVHAQTRKQVSAP